ncbi:membrane-spanning 4-domains subfamily A member 6A isoform X3 [Homo sapiens]|uniref:membrane-spanning 4-domains subfamily A member 6A isoform X3 n=2 Tax=Homo sapiens TaxID=9606 RepID=UPI000387B221|nr:membrane-spanning 4-domains subfamily A member 6A isoform X3 [Homo sapiens]XP_054225609.1 membrane-spanning 4-domains subfamily A member 6A isoform X3 [Homo sapiens]|eukprot:XP_006718724.1 membrane-spanning 4-domains subfamily A member 6A isoform X4 [Homo sapiens]
MVLLKLLEVYRKGSAGTFHKSTIFGNTIMTSQPVPNETIIVLPSNVINFSQAEKPEPTNQGQDSLKKHLHAEIKVIGFIISGSLSIATEKRLTKLLVHSSLVGSILSALSALVGFIILSVKQATLNPASLQCELDKNNIPTRSYVSYFYHDSLYTTDCYTAKASLAGTLSLMLICTLLEFCLAVLTAVLRWKQAYSDFPGVSVLAGFT